MLLSQTASWYITVCTYIWAIPPNYLIWLVYGQTYTEHYRITYQRNPPSTVNKRVWLYSTFTPKIGLIQGWFVLARGQYVQRRRANLSFFSRHIIVFLANRSYYTFTFLCENLLQVYQLYHVSSGSLQLSTTYCPYHRQPKATFVPNKQ